MGHVLDWIPGSPNSDKPEALRMRLLFASLCMLLGMTWLLGRTGGWRFEDVHCYCYMVFPVSSTPADSWICEFQCHRHHQPPPPASSSSPLVLLLICVDYYIHNYTIIIIIITMIMFMFHLPIVIEEPPVSGLHARDPVLYSITMDCVPQSQPLAWLRKPSPVGRCFFAKKGIETSKILMDG